MNVKKLNPEAIVPTRGSEYAAGYDLYACLGKNGDLLNMVCINPNEVVKVKTGIAVAIPNACFGGIFARSGLATKRGLRPANCVGVVDSDYRGEVIVALHNDSDEPQYVYHGDRIAQLVIMPYYQVELNVVDKLDTTERGDGGFGSTGVSLNDETSDSYEQLSFFDILNEIAGDDKWQKQND